MASQNSIVNHALDLLGETAIDDISDATEPAERLLAAWDDTRDAALRARWWRFSIQRTSLPADSSTPAWGYDYQYQIAGDVVRVIQVDQFWPAPILADNIGADTAPYRIEGDKILTDLSAPLKVRWIVNSVAVGLYDACFARVLACDLAERVCPRLTGSESMLARIAQQRRSALLEAVAANALEQPPTTLGDGSWVTSRFAV